MITHKTIAASDIKPEWLRMMRALIQKEGMPLRVHATLPMIEGKGTNTNRWQPINIPQSFVLFDSEADRDAIFQMLVGEREIPE